MTCIRSYSFRTSLGWVEIEFDSTRFEPQLITGKSFERKEANCIKDFKWISGQEIIETLYSYRPQDAYIVRESDGSLWFIVELEDSFYGVPEYLLQD